MCKCKHLSGLSHCKNFNIFLKYKSLYCGGVCICDLIGCCCCWKIFCLTVSTGCGRSMKTSCTKTPASQMKAVVVSASKPAGTGCVCMCVYMCICVYVCVCVCGRGNRGQAVLRWRRIIRCGLRISVRKEIRRLNINPQCSRSHCCCDKCVTQYSTYIFRCNLEPGGRTNSCSEAWSHHEAPKPFVRCYKKSFFHFSNVQLCILFSIF